MIRICIVCEGPTEVEFIKKCIMPHLLEYNFYAYPTILQAPSGNHRGGRVTIERLVKFISHQYHETDRITTLVDYYGFQKAEGRSRGELEQAIRDGVAQATIGFDKRFFLPYLQMHEFEALLFSDIEQFQWVLDGWNTKVKKALNSIRQQFLSPEHINNSRETAPSKRILQIFSDGCYNKTEHGPIIAENIGLKKMREQCPQFDQWLMTLENWT